MSADKRKAFIHKLISYISAFLIFFCIIAFVVTVSFLLFFYTVELPEEQVRSIAPAVFFNVLFLAVIFTVIDVVRRKITVDIPVKEISKVLKQLMNGDFSARIDTNRISKKDYNKFKEVAENVNLLAQELSGVETLRTDFISNVSHELKTPLAVMQNYGTMLSAPNLSDEKRTQYAKSVTDAARRLSNLITNILKLNKLENQQIFPDSAKYNLSEQLCESLLQFESVWEEKQIDIETNIADEVIVNADSELLSLVWNNLLSNAFKFTEKGGKVSVSLYGTEHHAVIKISDTGCGMTPQTGQHIFEKFYQGDTSHATQGNGLGLALVKRVVDILHGEIAVESVFGQGSTFTVKIRRI